jgi:glucosamine 6-phosphate synthetase-like amidotransferase/phosphosugar isomerase protein
MCGICGWKKYNPEISELLKKNQERGGYSVGILDYYFSDITKFKNKDIWDHKEELEQNNTLVQFRAPTTGGKSFKDEENYPLEYNNWAMFGNGIVSASQFKEMKDESNNNDLYYILKLIVNSKKAFPFKELENIEGTFALVFIDPENNIYLIRKDYPLYYSNNIISSTPFKGGELLEHGKVLGWNNLMDVSLNLSSIYGLY